MILIVFGAFYISDSYIPKPVLLTSCQAGFPVVNSRSIQGMSRTGVNDASKMRDSREISMYKD